MKKKILKIKVGSVYIDKKEYSVYTDAWERKDKKGNQYFEVRLPIFINEVEVKEENGEKSNEDRSTRL